ncbi:MAG: hypothetical protein JWN32_3790 [Solirubrobacterales bacterium]|nr:hypothetical protein [Solirubrobacterales bacterium]
MAWHGSVSSGAWVTVCVTKAPLDAKMARRAAEPAPS